MEKKQSSIEWYENKLIQLDIDFGGHKNYWVERKKLRDQAKAMHKEEIEFSYNCGWADGHDEATSESPLFTTGKEYYNETFGGDNE